MHKNADLDALGSAYYLAFILGDARIAADGMDRFATAMARKYEIDVLTDATPDAYNEIIAVDSASREQLGKFKDFRVDAVYDHHASNDIIADTRVVKANYPSCSELLYETFGAVEDRVANILLLGGIISDTDWFRHANNRTFQIFYSILTQAGLSFEDIAQEFEFPYVQSEKVAILKGMQRMRFRTKGRNIICTTIVGAHESSFAMLLIKMVDVVFVASQRRESVRITARSKEVNLLDIMQIVAEDFSCSYGGHKNAAGMQCMGDAEAILNSLIKVAERKL